MLKVLEIFDSIDGEGVRAGELTTFIRLAGCNLHCRYCDTAYSIAPKESALMSVEEIVLSTKYRNVTLTGGEPLLQKESFELMVALAVTGHQVNVETNGTKMPKIWDDRSDINHSIFYTVDYKCGASGHEDAMKKEVFQSLRSSDVIKCVVGSEEDMENAVARLSEWIPCLGNHPAPFVYFSPVFGKIEAAKIVDKMKEMCLEGKYRVQLQLHKFIWEPDRRLV